MRTWYDQRPEKVGRPEIMTARSVPVTKPAVPSVLVALVIVALLILGVSAIYPSRAVATLTADFSFPSATAGSPMTFNATASGGTSPYSFSWNFGDGTTGTGNPATHSYSSASTFTVTLTVTDAVSNTAVVSHGVSVQNSGNGFIVDFSFLTVTIGSPATPTTTASGGSCLGPCTGGVGVSFSWDFGDGTMGVGYQPAHTYAAPGIYIVIVRAADCVCYGDSAVASHFVTVQSTSVLTDFSFPTVPTATAGSPVTFDATASGGAGPFTFSWDFGDSTHGTSNPVTHTYAGTGFFTVVLTVMDSGGNIAAASRGVNVQTSGNGFVLDFSFPTTTVGSPVTFTPTASGGSCLGPCTGGVGVSFSWDLGDGTTSSSYQSAHTYSAPGTYIVVLRANDCTCYGDFAVASRSVNVQSTPVLTDFSHPTVTTGSPVTFNATISGGAGPFAFYWNFGDGTTGTGNPVTHTFSSVAGLIVILTVTDGHGDSATASRLVSVQTSGAYGFVLDFSFPTATIGSPTTPIPTASGGSCLGPCTGGVGVSFSWDFGDGTMGVGYQPAHTYAAPGIYIVVVQAADCSCYGDFAVASHVVTVQATPVTTDFSFPAATADSPMTFNATASGGTSPYSFSWNFGDDTTGTGNPVTHTYSSSGVFLVVLTVVDAASHTAVASRGGVIVQNSGNSFVVDFTFSTTTIGSPVTFTPTASGGSCLGPCTGGAGVSFSWDFGDGTTGSGYQPVHTYAAPGIYIVVVQAADCSCYGDFAVASHALIEAVSIPPLAGTTTTVNCAPGSVDVDSPTTCTATGRDTSSSPTTPSGTVDITSSGTGTFTGSPCTLSGTGATATCQVTFTPSGTAPRTDTIAGSYSGDTTHDTSSGTFDVSITTVALDPTTTSISCNPNPVHWGSSTTCTATVTDTSTSSTPPTGTVSFTSSHP